LARRGPCRSGFPVLATSTPRVSPRRCNHSQISCSPHLSYAGLSDIRNRLELQRFAPPILAPPPRPQQARQRQRKTGRRIIGGENRECKHNLGNYQKKVENAVSLDFRHSRLASPRPVWSRPAPRPSTTLACCPELRRRQFRRPTASAESANRHARLLSPGCCIIPALFPPTKLSEASK